MMLQPVNNNNKMTSSEWRHACEIVCLSVCTEALQAKTLCEMSRFCNSEFFSLFWPKTKKTTREILILTIDFFLVMKIWNFCHSWDSVYGDQWMAKWWWKIISNILMFGCSSQYQSAACMCACVRACHPLCWSWGLTFDPHLKKLTLWITQRMWRLSVSVTVWQAERKRVCVSVSNSHGSQPLLSCHSVPMTLHSHLETPEEGRNMRMRQMTTRRSTRQKQNLKYQPDANCKLTRALKMSEMRRWCDLISCDFISKLLRQNVNSETPKISLLVSICCR